MANQSITYNGHAASFHRLSFTTGNAYSEAGTLVGTRYDITVVGWVLPAEGEGTIAPAMDRLRFYWNKPRKKLFVAWRQAGSGTDEVFFDSAPPEIESRDPDMEFGPMPQGLAVQQVTGGLAAEYTFRVTATIKESWQSVGQKNLAFIAENPITSLTRTTSFSIDQDGFTTRSVGGKLTIVVNKLGEGKGPAFFRDVVTPPLPDGFVRERQTVTVDATGLSATFEFVDREVANCLPQPITSGNVTLSTSQQRRGGRAVVTLAGWFGAPKTVARSVVLQAALSLFIAKFNETAGLAIVEGRDVSVDLYGQNRVNFRFNWTVPKIVTVGGVQVPGPALALMVTAPPGSTSQSAFAGPFGTAMLAENVFATPYDPTTTTLAQVKFAIGQTNANLGATIGSPHASTAAGSLPVATSDVNTTFDKVQILELTHTRSYELKNHMACFASKVKGKAGVIQQTAEAELFVIDVGMMRVAAKSAADLPVFPDPPTGNAYLPPFVQVSNPTPLGEGEWSEYRLVWKYGVRSPSVIEGGTKAFQGLKVTVPADLRRASGKEEPLLKGPDGIVPLVT